MTDETEGAGEAPAEGGAEERLYDQPAAEPAGEEQPAEEPSGEEQQPAESEEKPAVAAFENLESREGDVEISEQDFNTLKGLFDEAEIPFTQETAQKVVDFEQDRIRAMQQAQQEAHQKQIKEWTDQVKQDRELGGEKFEENLTAAQEALGELATPELREVLEQTGLGNHPEMVRLFHKLAPMVREETPGSPGGGTPSTEQSRLERLYGKQA